MRTVLIVELSAVLMLWLLAAVGLAAVVGAAAALGDRKLRDACRPRRIAASERHRRGTVTTLARR